MRIRRRVDLLQIDIRDAVVAKTGCTLLQATAASTAALVLTARSLGYRTADALETALHREEEVRAAEAKASGKPRILDNVRGFVRSPMATSRAVAK